jgi:GTP-binding protein EngB required for normal cell division
VSSLNENHVRHVVSNLRYIDDLLREVERLAGPGTSPFRREREDLSPDESRLVLAAVTTIRQRMAGALERLGIPRPAKDASARWGIEVGLQFVDNTLSELGARDPAGYGELDASDAEAIAAAALSLQALVRNTSRLLHEHDAGGLEERIAGLDGRVGELLREVERISREHALVEVRPLLAAAVDRALSKILDVGVFGRVSSGKSSLINALAGAPVLPTGATPVTAVPVRVRHGVEGATVRFLDGATRAITTEEVAEFVTEEGNRENRLQVHSVEVTTPYVAPGLQYLDTPGVGSLSSTAPALAFRWLPRCDLGLVLVAAGSPVSSDDLALAAGLERAGIECHVLLSKSDLLAPAERDRAAAYVAEEFRRVLGEAPGLPPIPASAVPGHASELDELRTRLIEPRVASRTAAVREALDRRLQRLVDVSTQAMAGRTNEPVETEAELGRRRIKAAREIAELTSRLAGSAPLLLREAAESLATAWRQDDDARGAVLAVLLGTPAAALARIQGMIDDVVGTAAVEGDRRLPPFYDPQFLGTLPPLEPPRFGRRVLGISLAADRLVALERPLAESLSRYSTRLHAWALTRLEEIEPGPLEASAAPQAGDPQEVAQLRALLEGAMTESRA